MCDVFEYESSFTFIYAKKVGFDVLITVYFKKVLYRFCQVYEVGRGPFVQVPVLYSTHASEATRSDSQLLYCMLSTGTCKWALRRCVGFLVYPGIQGVYPEQLP